MDFMGSTNNGLGFFPLNGIVLESVVVMVVVVRVSNGEEEAEAEEGAGPASQVWHRHLLVLRPGSDLYRLILVLDLWRVDDDKARSDHEPSGSDSRSLGASRSSIEERSERVRLLRAEAV